MAPDNPELPALSRAYATCPVNRGPEINPEGKKKRPWSVKLHGLGCFR